MSTERALTGDVDSASPRTVARITGVVYLVFFLTAVAGAAVAPEISGISGVPGNAATIATYIQSHVAAVELAVALGLISTACYVALMAFFYRLFMPVSRTFAWLAVLFGMVGNAITAFGIVLQAAPLTVLRDNGYLNVFSDAQLQALALWLLHLSAQAGSISLVFFGFFQLALGYLIFRSTFLPRLIGVLIALAGLGWLFFLSPPLAKSLMTPLEVLGFVAEASLMLWLLVMGVNSQRWIDMARVSDLTTSKGETKW